MSDRLTRRELLQGKLGRVFFGARAKGLRGGNAPTQRVMRYPKTQADAIHPGAVDNSLDSRSAAKIPAEQETRQLPAVQGISIAPVKPTARPTAASRSIPVFRPPGAVAETQFLAGCTRCKACIEACPHQAIFQAGPRLRGVAGTPILDPDQQPCLMCADFPCITACEPGVLSSLLPVMMGTARITEHLCWAHHETPCTACSQHCPVPGAIQIIDDKPQVHESVCTGCGICRSVCPAPENAILLMPTFSRPGAPSSTSEL